MLADESVELMHQAGEDATSFKGQKLKANEGVAGTISDNGEAIRISAPADERLVQRNQNAGGLGAFSVIGAGVLDKTALVGVVEAVNKRDGTPFDDDGVFTLSSVGGAA